MTRADRGPRDLPRPGGADAGPDPGAGDQSPGPVRSGRTGTGGGPLHPEAAGRGRRHRKRRRGRRAAEAWDILEEIFADAYAGINAFSAHAERFNETVEQTMTERGVGRGGRMRLPRTGPRGLRRIDIPSDTTGTTGPSSRWRRIFWRACRRASGCGPSRIICVKNSPTGSPWGTMRSALTIRAGVK